MKHNWVEANNAIFIYLRISNCICQFDILFINWRVGIFRAFVHSSATFSTHTPDVPIESERYKSDSLSYSMLIHQSSLIINRVFHDHNVIFCLSHSRLWQNMAISDQTRTFWFDWKNAVIWLFFIIENVSNCWFRLQRLTHYNLFISVIFQIIWMPSSMFGEILKCC